VPCAAEHRRVGDTVLDAELAEPAIGKVHLHLGAAMLTSVNRTTLEIGLAFGISALFICEAPPAGSTGSSSNWPETEFFTDDKT
jgi:hypothetical protein